MSETKDTAALPACPVETTLTLMYRRQMEGADFA